MKIGQNVQQLAQCFHTPVYTYLMHNAYHEILTNEIAGKASSDSSLNHVTHVCIHFQKLLYCKDHTHYVHVCIKQ